MRKYKMAGEFELTGTVMRITDPGYTRTARHTATVDNCIPGRWKAATLGMKDDPTRIGAIIIKHEKVKQSFAKLCKNIKSDERSIRWLSGWKDIPQNIGVDTAQCGFYDDARYEDDDDRRWGVDYGISSSSGGGDGSYVCLYHSNFKKQVDAFILIFDRLENE